jgi:hypothetical protein
MLHELKHVGVGEKGLKLEEHDTEDFANILERYGIRWNGIDVDVSDICEDTELQVGEDDGR